MGMNFTDADIQVILLMADVFVEDGSYLLEENGECPLLRKIIKKYPDVAKRCRHLVYFLEHGEPPTAPRGGPKKKKKSVKKKAAKKTVKKKKKRATPKKTCLECKTKVHVRKRECPCGHEF